MKTETDALKRPFLIGILFVVIVVVFLGGLIALYGSTDDRPEGVAERWLTAVGELTRKGVHDDAVDRVTAHGDLALGGQLLEGVKADDKSAFTTLEVGKARREGDSALVPIELVGRGYDDGVSRLQLLVLHRSGDSWRVIELRSPDPTLRVPSEGGDVAAKAPVALYLAALVIGAGIAAAASALVRAAGREHESSQLLA
ncbi:MAG: hypothetical protein QOD92_4284 [Acidimicrobiaceae bacterium]|jgi:hypothetical protein